MFNYLNIYKDGDLAFNSTISELFDPITIDRKIKQMKKIYPDAVTYFPPNPLTPRGTPIKVSCFIDINHVGDKITRCYQSGIILYFNKYPIVW